MNNSPQRMEAAQARIRQAADSLTTPITRRSVLKGLGLGALTLAAPIWRPLQAQTVDPNQRFFAIFHPNGTVKDDFFPDSGAAVTSSRILAPLANFEDRLLLLKGVHMDSMIGSDKPGGPHMKGPGAVLTGGWLSEGSFSGAGGPAGYANNISVDQVLANHMSTDTAFKSLEYGVAMRGQEPLKYVSYRGANKPNPAVDDPWKMYDRIFSNFTLDSSEPEVNAQLDLERQSVLDYVKDELDVLNRRLPAQDRPRLDAHLTHIRSIEQQLQTVPRQQCEVPILGDEVSLRDADNYPLITRLQLDIMFQAQACGLTRVSSLMFCNADSWQTFPWLGIDEEHHGLSHNLDSGSIQKLVDINVWYSEQLAYFLDLLDSVPEANGLSMLDNSLVLCCNEIGQGKNHTHEDIPWLLAGSAAGRLRPGGQMLEYGDEPHNNLMLTLLHAFGMNDESSFGAPEHCTGPLSGLLA